MFKICVMIFLLCLSVISQAGTWRRLDIQTIQFLGNIEIDEYEKFQKVFDENVTKLIVTSGGGHTEPALAISEKPQWTVDPQGRFLVTTYYATPASPFGYTDKVALRRFAADGDLDSTFLNGKGWSHQMTPDREWFSLSAAVDPKGRILIIVDEGGPQIKSTNWIRAFSDTGQPDTTFGNSGVISVESLLGLTESQDAWTQHALTAPSGKILLSLQGYDPATNGLPIDLLVVIK